MVTILTLFLGLVTGPRSVEVAATAPVTRVELLLDGERVGASEGPPWRFEVDLGEEPVPHRLVAVGLDAEGAEVARTSIPINLQPREAGLRVVVEEGAGGGVAARLVPSSIDGSAPSAVAAWLDGAPVEIAAGPERFERLPLPGADLENLHFQGPAAARARRPDRVVAAGRPPGRAGQCALRLG